ncbi:MAG: hypothetical protein IKI63_03800 [Clostridia bacterium]|nr:hypothetical protein [Clostridia bacterium]
MSHFRVSVLAIAGEDEAQNRRLVERLTRQKTGHEAVQWIFIDGNPAGQASPSFATAFSHFKTPALHDSSDPALHDSSDPALHNSSVVKITADGSESVVSLYNRGVGAAAGEYTPVCPRRR